MKFLNGSYCIQTAWQKRPIFEPTMTCFLCSLAIEAVMGFCRYGGPVQVHAAAVRVRERLLLLMGGNRAGKSTLTARLMLENCIGYGDDLVGITPKSAVFSFGIQPRLRLPLPPSPALQAFVREYPGESDGRYRYVDASALLAPFGTQQAVDACIFLHRKPRTRGLLQEVAPDPAALLSHCVLHRGGSGAALAAMQHLAVSSRFFRLEYDSLDEAASLLLAGESAVSGPLLPPETELWAESVPSARWRLSATLYRRAEGVVLVPERQHAYLIHGEDEAIFRLNLLGRGLWLLLEQPLDAHEAVTLVQEAFPDMPAEQIRNDVLALFAALLEAGLIEPVSAPSSHDSTECGLQPK